MKKPIIDMTDEELEAMKDKYGTRFAVSILMLLIVSFFYPLIKSYGEKAADPHFLEIAFAALILVTCVLVVSTVYYLVCYTKYL